MKKIVPFAYLLTAIILFLMFKDNEDKKTWNAGMFMAFLTFCTSLWEFYKRLKEVKSKNI